MELNRNLDSFQLRKAYLISLCLTAQSVLAETTEQDEKPAEKALLEQVLQAITQPSGEHMQIYACLGLALAVIAGIVYMSLGTKESIKVTLDDVIDDSKPARSSKAKIKKPQVAEKSAAAKQDAEWEDDPYDKDTLYKTIDESGPYPKSMSGTMEPAAFCTLRQIIVKHTYNVFKETKEQLLAKRIEFLKVAKMKEYRACLEEAKEKYMKTTMRVTQLGAEFVDLDQHNFQASFQEAEAIPEFEKKLKGDEENVRVECEQPRDPPFTREALKAIYIEKMKMQFETEKKMNMKKAPDQETMMFQSTIIMDKLYMKHGVKMHEIQSGIKEHDLLNDEDVIAVKNANLGERQKLIKEKENAMKDAMKLGDEDMAFVKEVCAEFGPIDTTFTMEGTMAVDEYMKLHSAILKCQVQFGKKTEDEARIERLPFLVSQQQQQFAQSCMKMLQKKDMGHKQAAINVLETLDIPFDVYQAAARRFSTEQREKTVVIETNFRRAHKPEGYEILPKETTLEYIREVEMKKAESMAGILVAAQIGRFPKENIPQAAEMTKIKAMDELWQSKQVDNDDIVISFNTHKIEKDSDFQELIQEAKAKTQQSVQAAMMQMQQRMGGRGRGGPGMMGRGGPGMMRGGPGMMGRGRPAPRAAPEGAGQNADAADLGW